MTNSCPSTLFCSKLYALFPQTLKYNDLEMASFCWTGPRLPRLPSHLLKVRSMRPLAIAVNIVSAVVVLSVTLCYDKRATNKKS